LAIIIARSCYRRRKYPDNKATCHQPPFMSVSAPSRPRGYLPQLQDGLLAQLFGLTIFRWSGHGATMPTAASRHLTPAERLDWLRLLRSENIGPITFYQLLGRFGSAGAALEALPDIARRGGRQRPLQICPKATAERELARVESAGARLVAWGEPHYPAALAAVDDAPPLVSLRGQMALLAKPAVAVVGARNASANGRRFARDIALQLGQHGFLVVSGLARGIDAAAHEGALPTGTLAVLAGGIDTIYPEENRELQEAIAERGILVAEMPVGTEPQARHFPRRNRIISGCALGVIVVEAALRSGSLITARLALEQGRDVFAVPGSPLDPRCRGANDLIRRGATLLESIDDLLAAVPGLPTQRRRAPVPVDLTGESTPVSGENELEAARRTILGLLSPSPVSVDELVRQCQLSPPIVVTVLLELELAGQLERQAGNRVCLL
jgi:DNA processing protein